MKVIMYTGKNCGLCQKAKQILMELHISFQEIDVYEDDALLEKYQLMIPVIAMNGEELQYGLIEKELLEIQLIRRANN